MVCVCVWRGGDVMSAGILQNFTGFFPQTFLPIEQTAFVGVALFVENFDPLHTSTACDLTNCMVPLVSWGSPGIFQVSVVSWQHLPLETDLFFGGSCMDYSCPTSWQLLTHCTRGHSPQASQACCASRSFYLTY